MSLPFFIVEWDTPTRHKTLIQAADAAQAQRMVLDGKGTYLGYIDDDWNKHYDVYGPYTDKEAAIKSEGQVEGP